MPSIIMEVQNRCHSSIVNRTNPKI